MHILGRSLRKRRVVQSRDFDTLLSSIIILTSGVGTGGAPGAGAPHILRKL